MLNRLATATAALAVLGAWSVCAQPAPPDRSEGTRPPAVSREDAGAYLEAGIAALHSGLQLTPEQERLWPPFEQAVRELAKLRQDGAQQRAQERANQPGGQPAASAADDLMASMERRAALLTRRGAALNALAHAAEPLWQSLDDGQKRRFAVLARPSFLRGEIGTREGQGGFGRGFGPGGVGGPGRDGDFRLRRFGFGGPSRDDGDRYGLAGPRGFGPRGFGRDGDGYRYGFGPRPRDLGPREFRRREFGRDGDGYRYGDGRREFDRRDFGQRDLGRAGDLYRYRYGRGPREFGPRGFEPRDFGGDRGSYRYDYGPRDYERGRGRPGGGFRTQDEPESELGPSEASGADGRL